MNLTLSSHLRHETLTILAITVTCTADYTYSKLKLFGIIYITFGSWLDLYYLKHSVRVMNILLVTETVTGLDNLE